MLGRSVFPVKICHMKSGCFFARSFVCIACPWKCIFCCIISARGSRLFVKIRADLLHTIWFIVRIFFWAFFHIFFSFWSHTAFEQEIATHHQISPIRFGPSVRKIVSVGQCLFPENRRSRLLFAARGKLFSPFQMWKSVLFWLVPFCQQLNFPS